MNDQKFTLPKIVFFPLSSSQLESVMKNWLPFELRMGFSSSPVRFAIATSPR
jgi:hypothetical protein